MLSPANFVEGIESVGAVGAVLVQVFFIVSH